jgi:hypothetical protein
MIDEGSVAVWIEGYERSWRSPGTDHLADIFTPTAEYRGSPFGETLHGLEAIGEFWEAEREGPDEAFTMAYEVVAVTHPRAVARLEVQYDPPDGQRYRDLWVLEFADDGRCRSFEEWPFWPEGSFGTTST